MKKAHLSPVTSTLISATLVVGIFVAGLTNSRLLPGAGAQSGGGAPVAASSATLAGGIVTARGVVVNGVASDAVLVGGVRILDSVVDTRCGITPLGLGANGETVIALGVFTSGNRSDDTVSANGVFTSGNRSDDTVSTNGVFTSGNIAGADEPVGPNGVFTSGNVYVGSNLTVVGGSLSGDDVRVHQGVITGSDMQIVGAYVTSDCGR